VVILKNGACANLVEELHHRNQHQCNPQKPLPTATHAPHELAAMDYVSLSAYLEVLKESMKNPDSFSVKKAFYRYYGPRSDAEKAADRARIARQCAKDTIREDNVPKCTDKEFARFESAYAIHSGKKYRLVDCTKEKNPRYNVVFPSQFARLLIEYQEHPEAKSLAPDAGPCEPGTRGLLKRAHIIAGEFRYVGKETNRKWEEGDDLSVLEFNATEFGRSKKVVATDEVKADIEEIGINKCARESGFDRKNFIRKLLRGLPVKRNSYNAFARWLQSHKSERQQRL